MSKAARKPRKATRRRAIAAARTREDILMAAARALARSGFKAVSMQDIADEVGFTAPALYVYFESKEAIFAELLRTLGRELAETFEPKPPAGMPFRERLACLLRRQLEWTDRRREIFLAMFALRMRGEAPEAHTGSNKSACRGPIEYLQRLGHWMRRGDLGGHDPDEAACVLMGIGHGFFLRWITSDVGEKLADRTEEILDLFFHGVLGSRAVPSPRITALRKVK